MKRITKTYQHLCLTCGGSGIINNPSFNPNNTGSGINTICPICQGTGKQTITEIIEE